jgi:hypothetical protein
MKKRLICLAALGLAFLAGAADEEKVTVTGDRVSLRAEPDLNAVLLDRAMRGDQLVLKDNTNPEWVGVLPPEAIDLWVLGEYVENDTVIPAKLNVRSGPSLSHSVVGVVDRGRRLTVRGETAGWLRIAPPKEASVWISRRFVNAVPPSAGPDGVVEVVPLPEPEIAEVVEPEPPETQRVVIVETVVQPEINKMMAAAADVPELPKTLIPDPDKKQGGAETFSGILRFAGGILHKLTDPTAGNATVCYVRGNSAQMDKLEGRLLIITGPVYRALNLDKPFVRPVQIKLLEQPE